MNGIGATPAADVLTERARDLARRPELTDAGPMRDLLAVVVGGVRIGVDIDRVREVLGPEAMSRVPGSGHMLAGLRNVRGELVAVADLGGLLGTVPAVDEVARWVVVIGTDDAALGLLVDQAPDLVRVPAASVGRSPTQADPGNGQLLTGALDDGMFVVDADALLHDPRLFIRPDSAPAFRE